VVKEKVQSSPKGKHSLPDVNQLRRPFANDVHSEKLLCLAMEQELQHSVRVAYDIAPCDFAIARDTHLVGDLRSRQLLLGLPHVRNFRYRVNPVWEERRDAGSGHAVGMADRKA